MPIPLREPKDVRTVDAARSAGPTVGGVKRRGLKARRKISATQLVEDHIRNAIFAGQLRPRERLIEGNIATQLGCSRGPVREAVLRLERDGLIVITPRRGTFVRDVTPLEVEGIFSIRAKLEALCVRYLRQQPRKAVQTELTKRLRDLELATRKNDDEAFLKADMELHRSIWRLSQREQLFRILNSVMTPFIFMIARAYGGQASIDDRLKRHENYIKVVLNTPADRVEAAVEEYFMKEFSRLDLFHRLYAPLINGGWIKEARRAPE
jgi:DNA-binding GntR family transcriptional regulator